MDPIHDHRRVEQGWPNSSEFYKIHNNEQVTTAQLSGLGGQVETENVASVAKDNNDALLTKDFLKIQHLFQLSINYCEKYQVELSIVKNKLLAFFINPEDVNIQS